jgi:hypothetical protein
MRRLFWIIYRQDKAMTIRTGQPPAIDDSYCDLRVSGGASEFDHPESGWGQTSTTPRGTAVNQSMLQLLIIKSRVLRVLYSPAAADATDTELLKSVRELDDEVEQWRQAVPQWYRPSLQSMGKKVGRDEDMGSDVDPQQRRRYTMDINCVHLEYYHIVATIHETSGRCQDWFASQSENLKGISSSIAISAEASRSTLIHLDANIDSLVPQAFK